MIKESHQVIRNFYFINNVFTEMHIFKQFFFNRKTIAYNTSLKGKEEAGEESDDMKKDD